MPSTRGFWKKRGRGGEVWYCRHPVTNRQLSTGCRDLTAARLWRAQLERQAADPTHNPAPPSTYLLKNVTNAAIADRTRIGRSAATLEIYECKLSHVARVLGENLDVRKLTRAAAEHYIDTRMGPDEEASAHTVRRELVSLRVALKLVRGLPYQVKDVVPMIADGYEPRSTYLTKAQFKRLLTFLQPHRRLDIIFMALTGARKGEYERAERGDIRGKVVWLRGTKTKTAARSVPLQPDLAAAIKKADPPKKGRMFPLWHKLSRDLAVACRRAGLPRVSPNDLRRTYCTWLRDAGVDEGTCASLLGHTNSLMVRLVYGRATTDRKQKAIDLLGRIGGVASTVARSTATVAANGRRVRKTSAAHRR